MSRPTGAGPIKSRLSDSSPIAPPPAPARAPERPASTPTLTPVADPTPSSPKPAAEPPADAVSPEPAEKKTATGSRSTRPAKGRTAKASASEAAVAPKWTEFEAKTARLRRDQRLELTALAREFTHAKNGAGERITDNTLIRVAVDLLLAEADTLRGATTEEEMRQRLGIKK